MVIGHILITARKSSPVTMANRCAKRGASIAAENDTSPHHDINTSTHGDGWLISKEAERYVQAARRKMTARDGMAFPIRQQTNDEQTFPTSSNDDFSTYLFH
jgi:hypothetical protein